MHGEKEDIMTRFRSLYVNKKEGFEVDGAGSPRKFLSFKIISNGESN